MGLKTLIFNSQRIIMDNISETALIFIALANLVYLIFFFILFIQLVKTSRKLRRMLMAVEESMTVVSWFSYLIKKYLYKERR